MSTRRLLALWVPVVAFMALLFVLSEQRQLPVVVDAGDKVMHATAYAALGLLALRATHGGVRRLTWGAAVMAALLTIGYGALDEFHQSFVPGRDPSVWDLAADAVGAGLALAAYAAAGLVWLRWRGGADSAP